MNKIPVRETVIREPVVIDLKMKENNMSKHLSVLKNPQK
jgi:hypothetical protein